jgi:hypothetical protein
MSFLPQCVGMWPIYESEGKSIQLLEAVSWIQWTQSTFSVGHAAKKIFRFHSEREGYFEIEPIWFDWIYKFST